MFDRILLITLLIVPLGLYAQQSTLQGFVMNEHDEMLIGATVYWEDQSHATSTDAEGAFSIPRPDTAANLILQYVGYQPAAVRIFPEEQDLLLVLSGITSLQEVEVTGDQLGNYTSTLGNNSVEYITRAEFEKAACCSLAESFETNASVDVGQGNAVTGNREVMMLGLRGIYTQLMVENRPTMNGLAQPFALGFIPGDWVSSVQISKGASSVINGPQSMTGQINTELVKPDQDKPLAVNLYANHLGRLEGNVRINRTWREGISSGLLLHASGLDRDVEQNDDTFLDLPRRRQLNGMYRMFFRGSRMMGQFNLQVVDEKKRGGQLSTVENPWRLRQDNRRYEFFAKTGFTFAGDRDQSLGIIYNVYHHQYDGEYGDRRHVGQQTGGYLNSLYKVSSNDQYHHWTTGVSLNADDIREELFGVNMDRRDIVTGAYVQYSYNSPEDLTDQAFRWRDHAGLNIGLRADYHQRFGWFVTPRINMRVNPSERSVLRLSAGRGWRNPNFPPDWLNMLYNNWNLWVDGELQPEDAWVMGLNWTAKRQLGTKPISFQVDLYRTWFANQVVMDMETTHTLMQLYNLAGASFSNSALVMATMELMPRLDIKLAWKYNDSQTRYRGVREQLPYTPLHRGLATLDYKTADEQWKFNLTGNLVGSMRLPSHNGFPPEVIANSPQESPTYMLFNGQVTWLQNNLEIYLGGENLGNFTQDFPIVDWENPTSEHFDASRVFAPIVGTRVYLGLRWHLDNW